jgi:hypothetical protein
MSMLNEEGEAGGSRPLHYSSAILTICYHMSLSGEEGVGDEKPSSQFSDAAKHHRTNERTMLF